MRRGLWVIVPVRGIAQGKSRLAGVLDRAARARLNRRLLERTLRVAGKWQPGGCVVVSACARTLYLAARAHVATLPEPAPARGLDHAVRYAAAWAIRHGARAVLIVPSDLPQLSIAALDAMIECATPGHAGVIAPDAARTGTNALLLKARRRFDFRFGVNSCARHLEAARANGWQLAICVHSGLVLDIDLPHDLHAWRSGADSSRRRVV